MILFCHHTIEERDQKILLFSPHPIKAAPSVSMPLSIHPTIELLLHPVMTLSIPAQINHKNHQNTTLRSHQPMNAYQALSIMFFDHQMMLEYAGCHELWIPFTMLFSAPAPINHPSPARLLFIHPAINDPILSSNHGVNQMILSVHQTILDECQWIRLRYHQTILLVSPVIVLVHPQPINPR
jgi:hypothetical protein